MPILEEYEKDILQRVGLTQKDILFMEPDEVYDEVKHRIPLERCEELRGLLQLTSLKGLTEPTARTLYAAGVRSRWELLNMEPDAVVAQVNKAGEARWGEKERKRVEKILADNAALLDEI
jgi:nucleotidyltransferase/DNA polymerase involved in DNA repair